MLELKKIAVTGGLASGKTTVCNLFQEYGAYTLSADKIVHELLSPQTELGKKIERLLGPECVVDGQFDRKKIALKVFNDEKLLAKLEDLLHPAVQQRVEARFQEISKLSNPPSFFVVEIPLLFESNMQHFYDAVIVVSTDPGISKNRLSAEKAVDFEKRMGRQMSLQEKQKQAAAITLNNDGTKDDLKQEFKKIYQQLTRD